MSPLEYQRDLLRQVNEQRMDNTLNRINFLKSTIKEEMKLPEPINYENATAQLSILEEIYALELELGLHPDVLEVQGLLGVTELE